MAVFIRSISLPVKYGLLKGIFIDSIELYILLNFM
jgi:hypothetical protein